MNWVGVILWMIGEKLYKDYRKEKIIKKLESEKADDNISTQCDSCTTKLRRDSGFSITGDGKGIMQNGPGCRGFITGWDESRFRTLCPNCYEKLGVKLRDVKVYNLEIRKFGSDDNTPEERKKTERFLKLMGWR